MPVWICHGRIGGSFSGVGHCFHQGSRSKLWEKKSCELAKSSASLLLRVTGKCGQVGLEKDQWSLG